MTPMPEPDARIASKSEIVVAGPRPLREDNDRFLTARAVFHALFA
jgi:hypothetical protein